MKDARGMKVVFVSHCVLNQNSVVRELATRSGMLSEIVRVLDRLGLGIVQLPCPETGYCGLKRWWQTKEQYDSVGFRRYCRRLAEEAADLAAEFEGNGIKVVAVIGIRGSPSCGVKETTVGWTGGNPARAGECRRTRGMGVFMEEVRRAFEERGLKPIFTDVDSSRPEDSARELERELESLLK